MRRIAVVTLALIADGFPAPLPHLPGSRVQGHQLPYSRKPDRIIHRRTITRARSQLLSPLRRWFRLDLDLRIKFQQADAC